MKTIKIEQKHYDFFKKIANENQIEVTEIIDFFCDYVFDNELYKNFGKAFTNCKEEVEITVYNTVYSTVVEWSERYESKPATILEFMIEEVDIDSFKADYELI